MDHQMKAAYNQNTKIISTYRTVQHYLLLNDCLLSNYSIEYLLELKVVKWGVKEKLNKFITNFIYY
jgi:hypothetical protein